MLLGAPWKDHTKEAILNARWQAPLEALLKKSWLRRPVILFVYARQDGLPCPKQARFSCSEACNHLVNTNEQKITREWYELKLHMADWFCAFAVSYTNLNSFARDHIASRSKNRNEVKLNLGCSRSMDSIELTFGQNSHNLRGTDEFVTTTMSKWYEKVPVVWAKATDDSRKAHR